MSEDIVLVTLYIIGKNDSTRFEQIVPETFHN